ncbi:hypothetical protein ACTNBK_17165, partial [Intestinimonas sp. HCP28S3_D6]
RNPSRNVMAVPMGEITRALVGVRRRLCVKWGFVDMDVYEQEYRFCFFPDVLMKRRIRLSAAFR